MDFGFVGASYEAPSIYQDAQECINWFPEVDPTKAQGSRGVIALYPTPGLTTVAALSAQTEVRGMRTLSGGQYMVAVCGGYVYLLNSSFTPSIIGQLNTTSGRVGISDNGLNVYIVDGAYRYTWRISNPSTAVFKGTISGTTLTVTQTISGTIAPNQALFGLNITQGTVIVSGSGTTWTLNQSNTVASAENMNSANIAGYITGAIAGTTLTVSAISSGATIYPGQTIVGAGISANTIVTALGSGTVLSATVANAGTGYSLNDNITVLGGVYGSSPATYIVSGISTGVQTFGSITGGSGYTAGTYTNVPLTYVSGATATTYPTVNIVVSGGSVTSVTIATPGTGFTNVGTVLTASAASIGGTGSGFTIPVAVLAPGSVTAVTNTFAGQYTSLPASPAATSSSGQGTGLTLTLNTGTGTGGLGNYILSNSQTVSSETMYILNWSVLPANDGAFTGGTIVDIVDNYFIYNDPNTQKWAASNLLSPITYGLSFASKFTGPDNLVSLIADHGQVYLLGETTSEVWADTGTFPFAFQRIPGSSSQHGIIAPFSVARLGNSFAYLSRNTRGQSEIVMMNGYFPQRISTHAVENTLVDQYVGDAVAYTYQLEGHENYVISFPSLDLTWVYDVTTGLWHKWLWVDTKNIYHRHRSNCSAFFQGVVLVGDWENGLIYQLDPTNYTDNGDEIRRLRRAPHLVTDLQRQYFEEMQIQFQPGVGLNGTNSKYVEPPIPGATYVQSPYIITGTQTIAPGSIFVIQAPQVVPNIGNPNPQAMLRWSNDGGSTWSNEHWTGIGAIGKYKNRAIWRRLGWSRDRIFEVVVSEPVKAVIVSANLKASEGEN